jgi:hypothetical protein
MKLATSLKQLACVVVLAITTIPSCHKKDLSPQEPVRPGGSNSIDTISNHLRFIKSTRKQGSIPHGPANPSLKISFEDTLYLIDAIPRAVKFLHDKNANVAGVYLQVTSLNGTTAASHYYEVPEAKDMEDNDTVSVIMIGIEPQGLELPLDFDITITPYDRNGQPLAEAVKPGKIEEPKNDPQPAGNGCGLVLPPGDRWEWEVTYAMNINGSREFDFYNQPGKVFGAGGENIEGSCCSGKSFWPEFCPGKREHNQQLNFATYYKIDFETIRFHSNGTYLRQTMEDSPIPLPAESNFCGGGAGKVRESLKHTIYEGDWTLRPVTLPPDLRLYSTWDSLQLEMRGTGGTGTGYGNPGGVIHQLDCENGWLTLIQLDREGGRRHLFKFYTHKKAGEPLWYPFE